MKYFNLTISFQKKWQGTRLSKFKKTSADHSKGKAEKMRVKILKALMHNK